MIKEKISSLSNQNKIVLSNIFSAFIIKGFSMLLSLLTMPAYIHYFQNQTVLGVWFTIISVLNWVSVFDLGLGNGLRNKLPAVLEERNEIRIKQLISTTYFSMTVFALLLGTVGFTLIPRMNWNHFFNIDESIVNNQVLVRCVFIVYFGILLQFVLKLVTSVLYAMQYSSIVNFMSLISSACIVLALFFIPSYSIERNLYTMAVVNVIAMSLPAIVMSFWVYRIKLKGSCLSVKFVNKNDIKELTMLGISILWLQLIFMVISSTNEFLISKLSSPNYVVEYQAYNKIFNVGATVFSLALTPIWSAVTKAQAKNDYVWIKKIYKFFLMACVACFFVELTIVPFLQPLMDIWLGNDSIRVSPLYGVIFALSGTIFIIHNVNTSIGNGISYFSIQMIWMTVAALAVIPLSFIFVRITRQWIGVIIANIIALCPYEFLAPIYTMRKLNREIECIHS